MVYDVGAAVGIPTPSVRGYEIDPKDVLVASYKSAVCFPHLINTEESNASSCHESRFEGSPKSSDIDGFKDESSANDADHSAFALNPYLRLTLSNDEVMCMSA